MEKVSGMPFDLYMKENIFDPMGMNSTRIIHRRKDKLEVENMAYGLVVDHSAGWAGLLLLCEQAKDNGMDSIYDNIAIDNTAVRLFIECGFTEEYRTEEIIMLKKQLV